MSTKTINYLIILLATVIIAALSEKTFKGFIRRVLILGVILYIIADLMFDPN